MSKYAGKKVRVYIDINGVGGAGADYDLIAQQDDFSLKMSTDKIDARCKDDAGTPSDIISGHGWGGSFGGKLDVADPAWIYLRGCWQDEIKVWLKFDESLTGGATSDEGQCIVDSLEKKAAGNGVVEFTCSFAGQGELVPAVV